jgi:hypothetical protein
VLNVAVDLAVTAVAGPLCTRLGRCPDEWGRPLSTGELPLPAGNAQFATSVERFLGLEHVGRHCLTAPVLGL